MCCSFHSNYDGMIYIHYIFFKAAAEVSLSCGGGGVGSAGVEKIGSLLKLERGKRGEG